MVGGVIDQYAQRLKSPKGVLLLQYVWIGQALEIATLVLLIRGAAF